MRIAYLLLAASLAGCSEDGPGVETTPADFSRVLADMAQSQDASLALDFALLPDFPPPADLTAAPADMAMCDTPGFSIMPFQINFGVVKVGKASALQTVTLTGTGAAPVQIKSVTLAGKDPNHFAVADPGSFQLACHQSKTIAVSFQPVFAGMLSAELSINSVGFVPMLVTLTGTAM